MATATSDEATPATSGRRAAFGALALANTLWAGTYAIGKIALAEVTPIELNTLRFLLAALVLAPVLVYYRKQIPRDRRTIFLLLQLTLLGFVLNKALEYIGLSLSTASDVALLIATESIFTGLLSWIFLREQVTAVGVAALVIGLIGVYLIVERGLLPQSSLAGDTRIVGDVLTVLSLLLEAGYTVRGKTVLTTLPPLLFTALTITGSLIFWVPAGAIAVVQTGMPQITLGGWLAILYMAVITTALCYWLWFRGLSRVDASAAAPVLFIQPLLGAALAIILLHDAMTVATVIGAGFIVGSLLLVLRGERNTPVVVQNEAVP